MEHLWVPFALMMILIAIRFFILWFLPDTGPSRTGLTIAALEEQELSPQTSFPTRTAESPDSIDDASDRSVGSSASGKPSAHILRKVYDLVQRPQLRFCFLAVLLKRMAFSSQTLLYQYVSDVLGVALSNTAWLRVLQAIGATLVTGVGLPLAMQFLMRRGKQSSSSASFYVVQGSLAILVIGFIALWLGRHPAVIGIGKCNVRLTRRRAKWSSDLPLWIWRGTLPCSASSGIVYDCEFAQYSLIHISICHRHCNKPLWRPPHGFSVLDTRC